MIKIKGMGIALITPFTEKGEVDYSALRRLVEYQVTSHADFLCILCTTSEAPTLTNEEKQNVKDLVVEVVNGRIPIVIGCGGNCTASVIREIESSDFKGIDALLSVVPYYNKPSQEGLYQHFSAIAKASLLPVILYNVPGRVGVNMTAETTLRLARDNKNIIAIKEASGNFDQIDEIIKNKPKTFTVLSGDDSITFPLVTMGAEGVISVIGNAYPREFSKMVRLALNKEYDQALLLHHKFKELFSLLFVDGNPAGVKAALNAMGFCKNVLRLPLVPSRITTFEKIQNIVKEISR
jgi:4-hydroxy-tetrahydrodipicolinate synthase